MSWIPKPPGPRPRTSSRIPLQLRLLAGFAAWVGLLTVHPTWTGYFLSGWVCCFLARELRTYARLRRYRRYQAWLDKQPSVQLSPYREDR